MQLYLEGTEISYDKSLKDAALTKDSKIHVQVEHRDEIAEIEKQRKAEIESQAMESEKAMSEQKEKARKSQFAPAESLPKDPKAGYQTYPSMLEIKRMTLEQLENVKGFRIWTEFGEIEFLDKVDLTGVDLKEIITIDERGAEVYVDGVHDKPEVGKGLNVKSLITLNNIRPRKNQTASAKEEKLKRCLESKEGAQHISYNGDTGVWEFRVDHYTRWGDDSEEDEDE